ncbi:DsbA family protein [Streptomyces sp. PTM05]|uniref:DsbA family protein n=1 Tax=Streptantibioticus parmotrematis TaxID=2873249 RepID=A0ABS7QXD5_9ACTN|nr:thioredoxin domain-containing protein [Streptantibioticus parmotrematis]MBY8887371.1 DsbA family protein [Streptantibioticus parmotrematis]
MTENNRDAKRSARERMQQEREREKARAKRKRAALVGGSIVAVLVVAAVIGVVVANNKSGSSSGPVAAPPGATGKDDLAIPVGAANAPSTLTVYEDFRCPACDAFEKTYRTTVHQLMDSGQLRGEYHLVRLIDGNLGGTGSLNAGNAAACAQAEGRFRAYHDVLYDNQPNEEDDKFADKNYLIQLAGKVPGLKTPAFTSCVDKGTYNTWVNKSNADFNSAGFGSTPTILLNGKNIYNNQSNPLTPDKLKAMVAAANKGKPLGSVSPSPASAPQPGAASPTRTGTASRGTEGTEGTTGTRSGATAGTGPGLEPRTGTGERTGSGERTVTGTGTGTGPETGSGTGAGTGSGAGGSGVAGPARSGGEAPEQGTGAGGAAVPGSAVGTG